MNDEEKQKLIINIELVDESNFIDEFGDAEPIRCFIDDVRQFAKEPIEYYYTSNTTIRDMLFYLCTESGFIKSKPECLEWVGDYFMVVIEDHLREFGNIDVPLCRLVELSGYPEKPFYLTWEYSLPGGADVYEEDGIKFVIHTDEYIHRGTPHVHAEYSGEKLKIDIRSLVTKGRFKNRKKQKKAIEAVDNHREFFMKKWNELVGGLHVQNYYYDEESDSFHVEREG